MDYRVSLLLRRRMMRNVLKKKPTLEQDGVKLASLGLLGVLRFRVYGTMAPGCKGTIRVP